MTRPSDHPCASWTNSRIRAAGASAGALRLAVLGLLLMSLMPAGVAQGADSPSGLRWSAAGVGAGPSPRLHAVMAFEPDTGATLLFGGRSGSQVLGDTWTWDGTTWTLRAPATSPPPLESAAIAYDDATHQLLLFGGLGAAGTVNNATWAWDGTTWMALNPSTSPRARFSASLALNPATHTMVLFGGFALPGVPLGDTWTWDGRNWTQTNPAASPAARGGAGTTSDPSGVGIVIFGGSTGSQALGDTWTWDGTTWTQRNPSTAPSPRVDAGMAPESGAQTILLFGGSPGTGSPLGDTWTWNGTSWVQLTSAASGPPPSSRSGATLGIAPGGQGDVLFGGVLSDGGPTGETWTFGPPGVATSGPPPSAVARPASPGTTTTGPNSEPGSSTSGRPPVTPPPASSSTTKKPTPKPAPLGVTARSVHDGDTLTLSGGGFAAHATIVITFRSTPVVVGSTVADQEGRFSVTVAVPGNAPAGQHHFEATGPGPGGGETVLDAAIGVTVPRGSQSWVVPAVMVALTVLLAVGAAIVLTVSGRWNRPAATS